VSAIQIVQFGFPLLSSLGDQASRILEISGHDKITNVEIRRKSGTIAVDVLSREPQNLFLFASKQEYDLEDFIIFGNSKAIVEINNLIDGSIEF
jgi:hypothetical protein